MRNLFVWLLAGSTLLSACGDDDDVPTDGAPSAGKSGSGTNAGGSSSAEGGSSAAGRAGSTASAGDAGAAGGASRTQFTVTLENVAKVAPFTSSGVFNTPLGAGAPGALTPGNKYEFTIDAGRKQKLSFASMLAATNDLFFAPDGDGIALYDENGDPISGDVTDQIRLWDAGTEVNEEPKVGPNTVSKQAAPDTGPAEDGNVVDIADTSDDFDYPSAADVMQVTLTHQEGTQFKVTIENISSDDALQTSAGDFPAPLSPGVWVVHAGQDPLFTVGEPDRGEGLEHIAEDGNPADLADFAAESSGITYPASPGVWVVHTAGSKPLFTEGDADYGDGIEHIAEDGNPAALGAKLTELDGQLSSAVFNMPEGSAAPGPIRPGSKYRFSIEAKPGDSLSFASMLAATNDVFFAPRDTGIALFDDDGQPISGDVSEQVYLWDAGTEGNEQPGIGPSTVTNQLAADTGTPGEDKVQLLSDVDDGYVYPDANQVLKVTIESN